METAKLDGIHTDFAIRFKAQQRHVTDDLLDSIDAIFKLFPKNKGAAYVIKHQRTGNVLIAPGSLNAYPNNPEFLLYEVPERVIRVGT
jgi:hypothetical protein